MQPSLALARVLGLALLLAPAAAFAVSCTTQASMPDGERSALAEAARSFAAEVQSGDVAAVRARTSPAVASQFEGIAASLQAVKPELNGATLTIDNLYLLDASDLKAPQDTQFFCGLPGSLMSVGVNIPQLPPGMYALALLHATGVPHPQRLSFVLQKAAGGKPNWMLAGFFVRPMIAAGHDGAWYWSKAREYAQKKQDWDAWFYYETAAQLLVPVDFLTSPNLDKLQKEQQDSRPAALASTVHLTADGQTYDLTDLHTDSTLGALDLALSYKTPGFSDPVAARAQVVHIMTALLAQHPELRDAFHGLWVHALTAANQPAFALELPMDQIPLPEKNAPATAPQ